MFSKTGLQNPNHVRYLDLDELRIAQAAYAPKMKQGIFPGEVAYSEDYQPEHMPLLLQTMYHLVPSSRELYFREVQVKFAAELKEKNLNEAWARRKKELADQWRRDLHDGGNDDWFNDIVVGLENLSSPEYMDAYVV